MLIQFYRELYHYPGHNRNLSSQVIGFVPVRVSVLTTEKLQVMDRKESANTRGTNVLEPESKHPTKC